MKYVQINRNIDAWADSIVLGKHRELLAAGHDSYVFWGRGKGEETERCRRFASDFDIYLDALETRIDGKPGFHSRRSTSRLLSWLDEIDPDVVHLHNLLGYYINIEMLFGWLAEHRCKIIWTLHDCWSFTGHCIFFTFVGCEQWKTHCGKCVRCPQQDTYPETIHHGMEAWNYEQKRRLFTQFPIEKMSLVTPSQWHANLVRQSFMGKYTVEVHPNPVNMSVFKPTPSDFRKRYKIEKKFIVLGVASKWSERKGLSIFLRLASELDSEHYQVVLVGLSKRQLKTIPNSVLAMPRTSNASELAEVYTAADVLVNPSIEETFGMTVAEACACGTPVIVAEGSACVEAAKPGMATIIPADMHTLGETIIALSQSVN